MVVTPIKTLIRGVDQFLADPSVSGEAAGIHGDKVTIRPHHEYVNEDSSLLGTPRILMTKAPGAWPTRCPSHKPAGLLFFVLSCPFICVIFRHHGGWESPSITICNLLLVWVTKLSTIQLFGTPFHPSLLVSDNKTWHPTLPLKWSRPNFRAVAKLVTKQRESN